jgi:monoterpene epsilon-lactone hydrolase
MVSTQSDQFAQLLAGARQQLGAPGLDLAAIRELCEGLGGVATEPAGVTYTEVDAGGVPALWCVPEGSDEDSALIYLHAGGTVVFSMHSDRRAAGHLAQAAGMRTLVLDFRRSPEHKFPAQQDDVQAAYRWLLEQGIRPERIVSAGHSVGGNLAVSLALRLRDQGLPMPAAIVSISAWYDLELKNPTLVSNAEKDKILSMPLVEFFRESWIGGTDAGPDDPRVNLLHADLAGLPPLYVSYGTDELLVGEINEFADRARATGVDVTLREVPGGQHLFLMAAGVVPETDAAIADMGRWIRGKLA